MHWDANSNLELIAGSNHDGIFRAWSKESLAKAPDARSVPDVLVTLELD
jgi:hypothetical protein